MTKNSASQACIYQYIQQIKRLVITGSACIHGSFRASVKFSAKKTSMVTNVTDPTIVINSQYKPFLKTFECIISTCAVDGKPYQLCDMFIIPVAPMSFKIDILIDKGLSETLSK